MYVLAVICFDEIIARFGKNNIRFREKRFQFCGGNDFFKDAAPCFWPGEMPPVMGKPQVFRRKVLPCPIQRGQFAVMRVFFADIIPAVVWRIAN